MKRGFKGLSVLLSIIMVFCLFAPYSVYADDGSEGGEGTTPAAINAGGGVVGTTQAGLEFIDGEGTPKMNGYLEGDWHITYTLSATSNNAAWGVVKQSKDGFKWLFESGRQFANGDVVNLVAEPKEGYKFVGWEYTPEVAKHNHWGWWGIFWVIVENHTHDMYSEDGTSLSVEMKGPVENKTVKAIFEPITKYSVEAQVTPTGVGTVSGTRDYIAGETVTLTASAISTEYIFKQWSGKDLPADVSITSSAITFAMPPKNISVKADFEKLKEKYLVKVDVAPEDTGKFTVQLNSEAPSAEQNTYNQQINTGTSVTLTAVPSSALYAFSGWYTKGKDGVLVSANAVFTFIVSDKTELIAKFIDASGSTEPVPEGKAIIRDFHVKTHPKGHVDFDLGFSGSVVTGLVEATLTNGNPVRTTETGGDISRLQDWYENVPGTNYGILYNMELSDQGNGYRGFSSNAFFPIDGVGFGNEGNSHNFHFTLEYEKKFQYDPTKTSIKVASDDDLWIFINNKLAVDLGGHHSASEHIIDLSKTNVFEGKAAGDECTFKLFFAERNISDSKLSFKANFLAPYTEPVSNDYTVNANVNNENMGSVSLASDDTVGTSMTSITIKYPDEVRVFAIPKTGYKFVGWQINTPEPDLTDAIHGEKKIYAAYEVENGEAGGHIHVRAAGSKHTKSITAKFELIPVAPTTTSGSITVTKDVVDERSNLSQAYSFRSPSEDYHNYYPDIDDATGFGITLSGPAGFTPRTATVKEGSPVTFENLPFGAYYITEDTGTNYTRVYLSNPEAGITISENSPNAIELIVNSVIKQELIAEAENGTVSPASGRYKKGSVVQLGLTPKSGYKFDRWVEGDGYTVPTLNTSTQKYEVTMNNDKKVKAIFKLINIAPTTGTIEVHKVVVGKADRDMIPRVSSQYGSIEHLMEIEDNQEFTVTLSGSAIEAPISKPISRNNSAIFTDLPFGTYYLVETPLQGYERIDDPSNNTKIDLDEEISRPSWDVINKAIQILYAESDNNGTISPKTSSEGIKYTRGTVVELTIQANSGFEFDKWENGEGYTIPTLNADQKYEVTVNSDIRVKALFKALTPPVTPPATPSTPVTENTGSYTLLMAVVGQGTVSPGIGANLYTKGDAVQLSATPAEGWKFDGWQGDSVDASNQIRLDSNKSVTAVFSQITAIINDEPTPQAPVSQPQIVEMDDEETPAAPADVTALPKTGGVPATVFYGLGGFIAAMGVALRSKTKKKEEDAE